MKRAAVKKKKKKKKTDINKPNNERWLPPSEELYNSWWIW